MNKYLFPTFDEVKEAVEDGPVSLYEDRDKGWNVDIYLAVSDDMYVEMIWDYHVDDREVVIHEGYARTEKEWENWLKECAEAYDIFVSCAKALM